MIDLSLRKLAERAQTIVAILRDGSEFRVGQHRRGIVIQVLSGSSDVCAVDPLTIEGISLVGTGGGSFELPAPVVSDTEGGYCIDIENRSSGTAQIKVADGIQSFVLQPFGDAENTPEQWRDKAAGHTGYNNYRCRVWVRIAGTYRVPGYTSTVSG